MLLKICFYLKQFLQDLVENLYEEGNDLYLEGELKLSLGQYTEGLTVADYAASEELLLSQELLCKIFVNRSCCYYSMVSKVMLGINRTKMLYKYVLMGKARYETLNLLHFIVHC